MSDRREFRVWFCNLTGCAVGGSDINWAVTVSAASEDEALRLALEEARTLNAGPGLPPHGLKVSDSYLEQLAMILPDKHDASDVTDLRAYWSERRRPPAL